MGQLSSLIGFVLNPVGLIVPALGAVVFLQAWASFWMRWFALGGLIFAASLNRYVSVGVPEAFAHLLWREVLQRGAPDFARRFAEARRLSPEAPAAGPCGYRALTRLFVPVAAERISAARSRLFS